MNRWIARLLLVSVITLMIPALSWARGTRYFINWPSGHIGPVYVQVYDIRCNAPYELTDQFKIWVTWDKHTKCYEIGNRGMYVLKLYKHEHSKSPMMISGNGASFKIRYSLVPPWI